MKKRDLKSLTSNKGDVEIPGQPEMKWWALRVRNSDEKIMEWIDLSGRNVVQLMPVTKEDDKKGKSSKKKQDTPTEFEWQQIPAELNNLKDVRMYTAYLTELDDDPSGRFRYDVKRMLVEEYGKGKKLMTLEEQQARIQENYYKSVETVKFYEEAQSKAEEAKKEENKKKYSEKVKREPKAKVAKEKGPSITKTIEEFFVKDGTKEACAKHLSNTFPDRNIESLKNTMGVQLSYHLKKKFDIITDKKGIIKLKSK